MKSSNSFHVTSYLAHPERRDLHLVLRAFVRLAARFVVRAAHLEFPAGDRHHVERHVGAGDRRRVRLHLRLGLLLRVVSAIALVDLPRRPAFASAPRRPPRLPSCAPSASRRPATSRLRRSTSSASPSPPSSGARACRSPCSSAASASSRHRPAPSSCRVCSSGLPGTIVDLTSNAASFVESSRPCRRSRSPSPSGCGSARS